MGLAGNVVINDGLATPVAHTFLPLGPDAKGVWWFEDQSPVVAIAYKKISVQLIRPSVAKPGENADSRRNKVIIKFYDPVAETVSNSTVSGVLPAPGLAYTCTAEIVYLMPERATLQNRKDLRAYVANIHGNANIQAMIDSLQYIY